jgi:hypothetical protein
MDNRAKTKRKKALMFGLLAIILLMAGLLIHSHYNRPLLNGDLNLSAYGIMTNKSADISANGENYYYSVDVKLDNGITYHVSNVVKTAYDMKIDDKIGFRLKAYSPNMVAMFLFTPCVILIIVGGANWIMSKE